MASLGSSCSLNIPNLSRQGFLEKPRKTPSLPFWEDPCLYLTSNLAFSFYLLLAECRLPIAILETLTLTWILA